jgi:hypothetical protein
VGALQPAEALTLLDRLLGSRAGAEPAAAAELAALCGYLPLALRIAVLSLSRRPRVPLRSYAARLRRCGRLAGLSAGSDPRAVQAVFGTRHDLLDPALRGLLGLLAEQDFTPSDVAALLGTRTADAARLLDQLARATSMHRGPPDEPRLPRRAPRAPAKGRVLNVEAGRT